MIEDPPVLFRLSHLSILVGSSFIPTPFEKSLCGDCRAYCWHPPYSLQEKERLHSPLKSTKTHRVKRKEEKHKSRALVCHTNLSFLSAKRQKSLLAAFAGATPDTVIVSLARRYSSWREVTNFLLREPRVHPDHYYYLEMNSSGGIGL